MKFFKRPTPQPKLTPVEVPDIYGKRPGLSSIVAALDGQQNNPAVRAFVHLLLLRRTAASMSARCAAREDRPAAYDLGGVDHVDDVFNDIHALVTGQTPDNVLKEWFTEPRPDSE
jgi:hypothetical protein